jgi:hypothetical protein
MRWKLIVAIQALAGGACLAQPPIQLKVVKSSPFSAQAVTQSTQKLADGNRITHQTTVFIARDSEGRTRREHRPASGSVSVVFIQDPAAGVVYVLDPQGHSARKIAMAMGEADSSPAETKKFASATENGRKDGSNIRSEGLGIQIIEGFVVHGTRLTRTLASGVVGNERALEIVSEAWYSDELQTVVMNKTLDPRVGETVYRLTEIQRAEPARTLFEVPEDYTVREGALVESRGEKVGNQ